MLVCDVAGVVFVDLELKKDVTMVRFSGYVANSATATAFSSTSILHMQMTIISNL